MKQFSTAWWQTLVSIPIARLSLAVGVAVFTVLPRPAAALDALYVGGEIGNVGLLGAFSTNNSNAIGYGADIGLRANPLLDVVFRYQHSSHAGANGGFSLNSVTASADFHFLQMNDFDLSLGAGPGFYFFGTTGASETDFGLNAGLSGDVVVSDAFRVGLGFRYHGVFSATTGGNYWTAMARLGFLIEM